MPIDGVSHEPLQAEETPDGDGSRNQRPSSPVLFDRVTYLIGQR